MKRNILMEALLAVLVMVGCNAGIMAQGTGFAGTWTLDKSKSELPPMMQNLDSVTLVITQDGTQITREMKLGGGAMAGPGGGGGRGGGRMMMGGGQPASYKLDGSETVAENPRGKTTSRAKLADGGKVFEISSVMSIDFQGETRTIPSSERWELIDGGASLKVWQKRETPNGAMETTMVFSKK
ncbi:MAG: hypothetical protein ACOYLF_05045 [Blastocatellia bacterium]|jgi:hypothetical protein